MQALLQQVFEQVKTKAIYVAFVAGLSCSYLAHVPFLKTQMSIHGSFSASLSGC